MKQNELKQKPNGEQDGQVTDSVYDFLYHDARRVASFLAQFDNSGHLTQIAKSAGRMRSKQDRDKTTGTVLVVTSEMEHGATDEWHRESESVYDPMWANARVLLDYLDEAALIVRDPDEAAIGQIVLFTGGLQISDLMTMSKTWNLASVKATMDKGAAENLPAKLSSAQKKFPHVVEAYQEALSAHAQTQTGLAMFHDMIGILPHTIQAKISGEADVWCSLRPDGMTIDASDILLKHGTSIPGQWNILGILDARPDEIVSPEPDFSDGNELASKMMDIIAPLARRMLGRPSSSFGVTPLLVFRELIPAK